MVFTTATSDGTFKKVPAKLVIPVKSVNPMGITEQMFDRGPPVLEMAEQNAVGLISLYLGKSALGFVNKVLTFPGNGRALSKASASCPMSVGSSIACKAFCGVGPRAKLWS